MNAAEIMEPGKSSFERIRMLEELMRLMQKMPAGDFLPKNEAYERIGFRPYTRILPGKAPEGKREGV